MAPLTYCRPGIWILLFQIPTSTHLSTLETTTESSWRWETESQMNVWGFSCILRTLQVKADKWWFKTELLHYRRKNGEIAGEGWEVYPNSFHWTMGFWILSLLRIVTIPCTMPFISHKTFQNGTLFHKILSLLSYGQNKLQMSIFSTIAGISEWQFLLALASQNNHSFYV